MLALLLIAACSSTPATTGAISALPSDKAFSSLGPAEIQAYCRDLLAWRTTAVTKEQLCASDGLAVFADATDLATARTACRAQVTACMTAPRPADPIACAQFAKDFAACSVTVGELTTCFVDARGLAATFAGKDPCAVPVAVGPEVMEHVIARTGMNAASCEVVNTKCTKVEKPF